MYAENGFGPADKECKWGRTKELLSLKNHVLKIQHIEYILEAAPGNSVHSRMMGYAHHRIRARTYEDEADASDACVSGA